MAKEPSGKAGPSGGGDRDARLRSALRENLRRRKLQARGRAEAESEADAGQARPGDASGGPDLPPGTRE